LDKSSQTLRNNASKEMRIKPFNKKSHTYGNVSKPPRTKKNTDNAKSLSLKLINKPPSNS
jgi:hypothetical protein